MYRLFALAIAALLVIWPQAGDAQTIESVLRGLQERQKVLNFRDDPAGAFLLPIQWPEELGLEPFPEDGDIDNIEHMLSALQYAVGEYTRLAPLFLNYNTTELTKTKQRLMNQGRTAESLESTVDHVDEEWMAMYYELIEETVNEDPPVHVDVLQSAAFLPVNIGAISIHNWRDKLRYLASCVNELKVLPWEAQVTGAYGRAYNPSFEPDGNGWYVSQDHSDMSITFPGEGYTWAFAHTASSFNGSTPTAFEWRLEGGGSDEYATAWAHFSGIIGLRVNAGPLGGRVFILKAPVIQKWGDLGEAVANLQPTRLKVGSFIDINSVGGGQVSLDGDPNQQITLGTFYPLDPIGDPYNNMSVPMDYGDAVTKSLELLNLSAPIINGSMTVTPPAISMQNPWNPDVEYAITLDQGADKRRRYSAYSSYHWLDVSMLMLLAPRFTELLSASEKNSSIQPRLGEVELTMHNHSLFRVHVGRGIDDHNQFAWLSGRSDGFGSLQFFGSSNQFDALYEDDWRSFEHDAKSPIGDRTFNSIAEFTTLQKQQSGWQDRIHYITHWFFPRLRQVKGRDVLVDITYVNAYKKTLAFYWAKDIGPLTGKFYSPVGTPFRTLTIENPTVGTEVPLPTDKGALNITEGGIIHSIRSSFDEAANEGHGEEHVVFKVGENFTQDIVVPYNNKYLPLDEKAWIITETNHGRMQTRKLQFEAWANPIVNVAPRVKSSEIGTGATKETTVYTWGPTVPYVWSANVQKIEFTGPASWSESGRVIDFNDGLLASESRLVSGKALMKSFVYNDNEIVETHSLAGQEFKTIKRTYSPDFKTVAVDTDGKRSMTATYVGVTGNGNVPSKVEYPGGYTELTSFVEHANGHDVRVTTGWGADAAGSRTVSFSEFNRYGGLKSAFTTSLGVTVHSAVGSDFLPSGQPKKITYLRGSEDFNYVESGPSWGMLSSTTDPFTRTTTISGYDDYLQPTAIINNDETHTFDYSVPNKVRATSSAGYFNELGLSGTGAAQSFTSTFGEGSSITKIPGGAANAITAGGRSKSLTVDPSGMVKGLGNGIGGRGGDREIGVDNKRFYVEETARMKDNTLRVTKTRTIFDGHGRVVAVTGPDANGTNATATWEYDDANQKVTFKPGVGPVSGKRITTLSDDGAVQTVSFNGKGQTRVSRTAANGAIVNLTEINDDSSTSGWIAQEQTTFDPATGITTHTPWGLPSNKTTVTTPVPGATGAVAISGGPTNETMQINLAAGWPSSFKGTTGGVSLDINNLARTNGLLNGIHGTLGGKPIGLQIGADRRVSRLYGPGTDAQFGHGGGAGYQTVIFDTAKGKTRTVTSDSVGDPTSSTGDGALPITLTTTDTATGSSTTHRNLTSTTNLFGALLENNYGGIRESRTLNGDGSTASFGIVGPGRSMNVTVSQNANSQTVSWPEGAVVTNFFDSGPESRVTAPNDQRAFAYKRMELANEIHEAGPWQGWGLAWKTDKQGRVFALEINGPGVSRTFGYGYDQFSRLNKFSSANHSSSYTRNDSGQLASLRRGRLTTTWGYDPNLGRLTGISNANASGTSFGFAYPEVDAQLRIRRREASVGVSWRQLGYDNLDQLRSAQVTSAGSFAYDYDNRGNRNGQGPSVVNAHNGLDQFTSRTLLARGFGIFGAVRRDASLLAFHPLANVAGDAVGVDPLTGNFFSWWNVPSNHNNGLASRMDTLVRATAPNPTGPPPVSESTVYLTVPPNLEIATYDFAGRMTSDAYWVYGWDAQGRMTDMTRKDPTLVAPDVLSERLEFIYDADGRRTLKRRTVTYPQNKIEIEESQVLWAKWLPVYEIRRKNGAVSSRRWFQWGADLSGTLDGAGGIGGLVAIIEENAAGAHTRTLLPIQDGLGNVTAVVDALTGSTVARYDYGPFGEPLGVSGDADACPFRFQTKWYDKETEHYYFGYRYYSPRLGRWLSRDPLGEAGGINLYAYCGNDPVNRHDPLGLKWVEKSVMLRNWHVAGHGSLSLSRNQWVWEEEAATPEQLLLSLLNGLNVGAKDWGVEQRNQLSALTEQLNNDPSAVIKQLGIDGPEDILELIGRAAVDAVTFLPNTALDLRDVWGNAWKNSKDARGNVRPNHAVYHAGVGTGPTAGAAVVGYILHKARLPAKGGGGTTRLFRAVEGDELADVMRYGDYNIHANSTFKRFALDEGSLDTFIKANPGRSYTKTFIDVPTENLGQMYRHADPGGVGKSIGIDVFENPTFYNWFDKVNILGK